MNTADRVQYNVLLGSMRAAAERYGAADAEARRAEDVRDRAAAALEMHELALDRFIDRLTEEDDDDGPCMCVDCVRVRSKGADA